MSDGETLEQAATNIDDAIACWIDTARRLGREVPAPGQSKLVRA
ncbi:MAG: type II toxin-antitoxin system HicB family antitoxin [Methylobacteriaceae bacterium]|nr:type II toxin-antitoxin system HicB family antitoxin [Methylobacteriaceae bacterium]